MIDSFSFEMKYGKLVHEFTNGCIVISSMPEGHEIAITRPNQAFPIRTLNKEDGNPWRGGSVAAEERANKIVTHLLCEYGVDLPKHLVVSE